MTANKQKRSRNLIYAKISSA